MVNSKILFNSLLIILVLLPIPLGSNRPWAWSIFQILIFLLTLACVYYSKEKPLVGISKYKSILYLWVSIIILASLQIIPFPAHIIEVFSPKAFEIQSISNTGLYYFSLDQGQSEIGFFKLLAYFCLFFCTLVLVNDHKRIKIVLMTMVAAGTFQALYGALELLLGMEESLVFKLNVANVATGSFVYKNHYANFLIMCLSAGIGLMVAAIQKDEHKSPKDWLRNLASTLLSSKALIRISIAIMVIALVMSRSRMGNTAFFMSMTIVGVLALVLIKKRSKGLTILIASMFIIDLFIVSAYFGLEKVQERLVQTSLEQESRDEVIRDAIPIVYDFPLMGTGSGSFYSIFPSYKTSNIYAFYDHAHNDYLQLLIEYGLLIFTLLGLLVALALYKSIRAIRMAQHEICKGAGVACSMAIIGMLIHMTVDFPLQAFANTSYFVVFIALAMAINRVRSKKRMRRTDYSKHTTAQDNLFIDRKPPNEDRRTNGAG